MSMFTKPDGQMVFENAEYATYDNGFFRPFTYYRKSVGFDGTFYGREETIWVCSLATGSKLLEHWNFNGQLTPLNQGFYPRYEFTFKR